MSVDSHATSSPATVPAATWSAAAALAPRRAGGKRVLVLGWAPLPFENARMNYAPGARAWQLARPLAAAGHAVCLGLARIPGAYGGDPAPVAELERDGIPIYLLAADLFAAGDALDRLVAAFRPDVLVGAAAVPSGRAVEVAGERPVWVDVFGDPMAEAQAKAAVHPEGDHLTAYWRLTADLLERGDAFSAVSERQRYALIGQLGLAGRLNRATSGHDLVHTIPLSVREAGPAAEPVEGFGDRDFVVLWSGGYNTWCDVETLFQALEGAMARDGTIRFVSTGGGIEGQDDTTYPRFQRRVAGSRFGDRFHLQGRLPERRAAAYLARADLGVVTEKPIYERFLGSSARLLGWIEADLPFVCARVSELSAEAEAAGLGTTYPAGDAEALAARILEAAGRGRQPRRRPPAAAALVARLTAEATTRPLKAWVEGGGRAPDHGADRRRFLDLEAVASAALADRLAARLAETRARAEEFERRYHRVRGELGEVHKSKMWRLWMAYLALRRALLGPFRRLAGGGGERR